MYVHAYTHKSLGVSCHNIWGEGLYTVLWRVCSLARSYYIILLTLGRTDRQRDRQTTLQGSYSRCDTCADNLSGESGGNEGLSDLMQVEIERGVQNCDPVPVSSCALSFRLEIQAPLLLLLYFVFPLVLAYT